MPLIKKSKTKNNKIKNNKTKGRKTKGGKTKGRKTQKTIIQRGGMYDIDNSIQVDSDTTRRYRIDIIHKDPYHVQYRGDKSSCIPQSVNFNPEKQNNLYMNNKNKHENSQHIYCEIDDMIAFTLGYLLNVPVLSTDGSLTDVYDSYLDNLTHLPMSFLKHIENTSSNISPQKYYMPISTIKTAKPHMKKSKHTKYGMYSKYGYSDIDDRYKTLSVYSKENSDSSSNKKFLVVFRDHITHDTYMLKKAKDTANNIIIYGKEEGMEIDVMFVHTSLVIQKIKKQVPSDNNKSGGALNPSAKTFVPSSSPQNKSPPKFFPQASFTPQINPYLMYSPQNQNYFPQVVSPPNQNYSPQVVSPPNQNYSPQVVFPPYNPYLNENLNYSRSPAPSPSPPPPKSNYERMNHHPHQLELDKKDINDLIKKSKSILNIKFLNREENKYYAIIDGQNLLNGKVSATKPVIIKFIKKLKTISENPFPPDTQTSLSTQQPIPDTKTPQPIGGKTKKTRKHKGIHQTGGNKGRLKKGYKYSGKRLKSGLPEIVKCKSKKCNIFKSNIIL